MLAAVRWPHLTDGLFRQACAWNSGSGDTLGAAWCGGVRCPDELMCCSKLEGAAFEVAAVPAVRARSSRPRLSRDTKELEFAMDEKLFRCQAPQRWPLPFLVSVPCHFVLPA
jgi:hypothetical protein